MLQRFSAVKRIAALRGAVSFGAAAASVLLAACVLCAPISRAQRDHAGGTPPEVTPVQQADASCAHCHAAIYASYLRTPKARASGLATANLVDGTWTQPASGVTYQVGTTQGAAWLRYTDPQDRSLDGQRQLAYFLGSGHLGVTYLYSTGGYLMESPVAYYSNIARYDMNPGLAEFRQVAPAIPIESECLRCHMSGVQRTDAGTLNHYSGVPFLHGGITCESCHGDTAAHVRSGGQAPVVNPAKLTPERRDSVCISCHLEGDVSVEKNGRSALDFRPGDSISTYLSFFVYGSANATVRGVSEVEQFAVSHCKRASGDRMSCTSCHDPHFTPTAAEKVDFYRGKCLACHNVGTFATTHHPENPDCTSCHMPRNTAENIPHIAWTDHRILARPSAAQAAVTDFTRLVPIFSPAAAARDEALALYLASMKGHTEDSPQAYALLSSAAQQDAKDVQVLDALGTLAAMKGDATQAASLFRAVLAMDATDRSAATNLAILDARAGNLEQARALLQPVFERNQDVLPVALDLSAIACKQGDPAAARATLQAALHFSPSAADLKKQLANTASCGLPSAP